MKRIELASGVKASILGFGCAPIMGSVDEKRAKYALSMALDNGINYLDLARSYGYGEAEAFVGKIIKDRTNELYIATKFGIIPNWKAGLLNQVKPMVRLLKNLKGESMRGGIKSAESSKIANRFLERVNPLLAKNMIESLEKSLRELKRDHVDFLFVHEPHNSLNYIDELISTAEKLKKDGKIRSFGLAAMHSQNHLHGSYIDKFDLLQYDNPLIRKDYQDFVLNNDKKPSVIFSPFRGGPNTMEAGEKLRKLFNDFPNSVVLCSMFNPDHLRENIKCAESISSEINS